MGEKMEMITLRLTDDLKQRIAVRVAAINVKRAETSERPVNRSGIFREALEEWLAKHLPT